MKFYSLKSLVPEITGIDENNVKFFDAALKSVQRIERSIRNISSYYDTNGIPENNKDEFVSLLRDIYEDDNKKKVLNKYSLGKVLNEDETLLLFDTFVKHIKDEDCKEIHKILRDEIKGDSILKKLKEINESVLKVVNLTDLFVYDFREDVINNLKNDIQKVLDEYEERIHALSVLENLRLKLASIENEVDRLAEFDKLVSQYPSKKEKTKN